MKITWHFKSDIESIQTVRFEIQELNNQFNSIFFETLTIWPDDPSSRLEVQVLIILFSLTDKSWKTRPDFFPKFQYPGAPNQTNLWKTNPTVFEISIYRVWAGHIFWKFLKVLFWMSFPESGLCNALNSKIDDWMSFPVIRSCSFTGNLPMVECRLGHFEEIRNSRKRTQTGFRYSCPQNSDFNLFSNWFLFNQDDY